MSKKVGYMEGLPSRSSALIIQTMRDIFKKKGIIIAGIFLLIPCFIAVYTLADPQEGMKEWWIMFSQFGLIIYLQILVLLYCLVYGTSMIHQDLEGRTMTYLVIRGAKRFEVLVWRYIGTVLSLMLMFTGSITLTYFLLAAHGPISEMTGRLDMLLAMLFTAYLGIIIYIALFSMFGTIFRKPLMVGLLFSFFWEVVMVNIPMNIRLLTVMHYLRSFLVGNDHIMDVLKLDKMASPTFSIIFLLFLSVIFIVTGSLLLSRKEIN